MSCLAALLLAGLLAAGPARPAVAEHAPAAAPGARESVRRQAHRPPGRRPPARRLQRAPSAPRPAAEPLVPLIRPMPMPLATGTGADAPAAIEAPRPLLPPDEGWMPSGRPLLQWSAPEGADRFRLQLARAPDLSGLPAFSAQTLIEQVDVERPQWQSPPLPPGRYQWRIAALACTADLCRETGDFGPSRTLNVPWPLPELLEPSLAANGRLRLQWTGVEPEALVQLQIAADEDFLEVLLDEPRAGDRVELPPPPPTLRGPLYLRIRPLPPGGGHGPWSSPRSLAPTARAR